MRWLVGLAILVLAFVVLRRVIRRWANRAAVRAVLRFRSHVDRYKLASKARITAHLLDDEVIAAAVRQHAAEHHQPREKVWLKVEEYLDEIIPFFNILAYYKFGFAVSRWVLNLFYKVVVEHVRPASEPDPMRTTGEMAPMRTTAERAVPRDAIVIYLINHRSNADYVLVGYALSGRVAISYAVGEWARAFPLEYLFKTFGSYFIRRRFREPLYHTVLERYIQHITKRGVTQGIFPEGGLSRDGCLQPGKIGLLDYMLGVARDPAYRPRMYLVPVAVGYDRVLEDRSLLRARDVRAGGARPSRLEQMASVFRFVWWNVFRLAGRRWKRYGLAAVTVGHPVPLAPWFEAEGGSRLFELPRPERLARVQSLCDDMLARIGAIVPVTPVPLACAAIQSFDADFIPREKLIERMSEMRDVLGELNARVLRGDRAMEETFERAWRMLEMRRILARSGDGYVVLPRGRELVSYYANGIAHLLGPFERGIRARDALPMTVTAGAVRG